MRRAVLGLVLLSVACEDRKPPPPAPAPATAISSVASPASALPRPDPGHQLVFAPIPEAVEKPVLDEATKLGQMLFFDPRLSSSGKKSCASCHDLARAGIDEAPVRSAPGGPRNVPTVINAAGSFAQGWDARASTMEEFVLPHAAQASVLAPDEKTIVDAVGAVPAYAAAFKKAFPDAQPALSSETVGRALAAFTKKLFARAPWDRYLAGDKSLLGEPELVGLAVFVDAGCTTCHQGKYVGATQTQKLGIAKPWPPPAGTDPGRFEVSKQDADRGMFKVPSLRNVTRTAPYLHDGSVATLEETTRLMARHQVGRELTDPQVKAIVTFLATLNGDPPKELVTPPKLPPGGKPLPRD